MGTLLDLDPKPQGGEWYSVLYSRIGRVVVFVESTDLVLLSKNVYLIMNSCKDPILLNKYEAEKQLNDEIKYFESFGAFYDEESIATLVIKFISDFKKEYFG